MQVDLKNMNEVELKALVYDQLAIQGKTQNNINILEKEIAARHGFELFSV